MATTKHFCGRLGRAGAVAAAVVVWLSGAAWGQQATGAGGGGAAVPGGDDAAWRQRMEERMRNLEQENAALRQEVGRVVETKEAVARDAATRGVAGRGDDLTLYHRPGRTTPYDFDVNKYVAEGDFPGSLTIPGTNISVQVGGFAQLDAITDTNAIGSKDSFVVSSIPTSGESAGQTNFSVRQTRLFLRTEAPTGWGKLVTYVEGDFFGPDGTDFRLRHAFGEIGDKYQLLAGQTWTTFMDATTYPAIFDYQGPNGMVLVRQPMIRYTQRVTDDFLFQVAVEDPNPDLSEFEGVSGNGTSLLPDFTGNVRWSPKWGHLQVSGILRQLTFDPAEGSRSSGIGWGLNLSGHVNVLPEVAKGKRDNLVFQIAGGQGIANYFNDTNGLGQDGFVKANGDLQVLGIWGGFAAYQHFWNKKWGSTLGYSYLHVDGASGQAGSTYRSGHYVVANLTYYPAERVWIGLEALYGIREDQDGSTGDDGRLSFSVQYRF